MRYMVKVLFQNKDIDSFKVWINEAFLFEIIK